MRLHSKHMRRWPAQHAVRALYRSSAGPSSAGGSPPRFEIGQAVRIAGIQSRPELNGKVGTVESPPTSKNRYHVRVSGEVVSLRADKLTRVVTKSAPEPAKLAAGEKREIMHRLETDGLLAFPLPSTFKVGKFIMELDKGTRKWFEEMIVRVENKPITKPGAGYDAAQLRDEKGVWDALSSEERQRLLAPFNTSSSSGRIKIHDSKERAKEAKRASSKGVANYLKYLVQTAKQGNVSMSLGSLLGWWGTGFGLWGHTVPQLGLEVAMYTSNVLQQLGFRPTLSGHFPHIIYKSEVGSNLDMHHDQITPAQLLSELEAHIAATHSEGSTIQWIKRKGIQLLTHIEGGRRPNSGATYILGPMTCSRLLLCLRHMKASYLKDWNKPVGPYFIWEEMIKKKNGLEVLNDMLQKHGRDEEEKRPLRKMALTDGRSDGAYVVGWPVGFPHGSFSTDKEKGEEKKRRITFTLPIDVKETDREALRKEKATWESLNGAERDALLKRKRARSDAATKGVATFLKHYLTQKHAEDWLRAIATVATDHPSTAEHARAKQKIENHKYRFADGPAHGQTYRAYELHARGDPHHGWFNAIAPTKASVERFIAEMRPPTD